MAIDIIARGLATSLIGADGKLDAAKMPIVSAPTGVTTFFPVGGLTSIEQIQGKTAEEILIAMLFGMLQPTIIEPSYRATLTSSLYVPAYMEQEVTGTLIFDAGAIQLPNGTSTQRAGDPIHYTVNDLNITSSAHTVDFSIRMTPMLGSNVIETTVTFAEGPQPIDSLGQPFDKPYPAGKFIANLEIEGISSLTTATGAPIEFTYTDFTDGLGYQAIMMAETDDNKQSFQLLAATPIVGIKQFNPLSQSWEWIGGTPAASLATFDTIIIEGATPDTTYISYTHNGSIKGQRELRLYTTLN